MLCTADFGKPSSPAIMWISFLRSSLTAVNTRATFSSVRAVEGWSSCGSSSQLSCPSLKRFTNLRMVELFKALCSYTCFNMVSIAWASSPSFVKNLTFIRCSIASFVYMTPRVLTHINTTSCNYSVLLLNFYQWCRFFLILRSILIKSDRKNKNHSKW